MNYLTGYSVVNPFIPRIQKELDRPSGIKLRMLQVQPKTACGHFCGKGLIFHIDDMFSMPTIPCRYLWGRSQTTLTRQGR